MDKKICVECGTENEEQYLYCKNCGAALSPQKSEEGYAANPDFSSTQNDFYTDDSYINGIPEIEYQLYIGQKHEKFIPKFKRMEFTATKYSWCWAPAVLGLLGGPLCAALWFFYRKIYKPAWLLVAIGAVLSIITGILTMNTTDAYYNSFMDALSSGNFDLFLNTVANSSETIPLMLSNAISDISSMATAIFTGLFAHNIYKNHIGSKILEYKTVHSNPQHYRLGLTYIGGTSGGMLTVGFLLLFGINNAVSIITTILAIVL